MDYLKAERVGPNKFRVLAIPFGGPFAGKDLDEEFFSKRTDIKPDWFDRRPLIWHHNLDQTMKADSTIGTADDLELDEDLGWWSTVWLDRSHRYWSAVDTLLGQQKLYGSSGTMPNFVRTDKKTGEILVWPYVEQTLTPTPSNFQSQVHAAKAAHFVEAGIAIPRDLLASLHDPSSPTADLGPDLATAVDPATRERLTGDLSALLERTNRI